MPPPPLCIIRWIQRDGADQLEKLWGLPSKLHSGGPRSEGIGYVQAGVWPMGSVAGFREKLWGQVVYRNFGETLARNFGKLWGQVVYRA